MDQSLLTVLFRPFTYTQTAIEVEAKPMSKPDSANAFMNFPNSTEPKGFEKLFSRILFSPKIAEMYNKDKIKIKHEYRAVLFITI